MAIASVSELWRYPVKSLGGERLQVADIGDRGVRGDRHWAVYDPVAPIIRSAKQWPALLELRAEYLTEPGQDDYGEQVAAVRLQGPDGSTCDSRDPTAIADWLRAFLDQPAQLKPRVPAQEREFYALPSARTEQQIAREIGLEAGEALPEFGDMDADIAAALQFHATPPGFLYDAFPVHLLTTDSLRYLGEASGLDVDVRRFRPNILLHLGSPSAATTEQQWIGSRLQIGDVILEIDSPTSRCSMPGRAQPAFGLQAEKDLPRAMARHVGRNLGVNARVIKPGRIHPGDPVHLLPREAAAAAASRPAMRPKARASAI